MTRVLHTADGVWEVMGSIPVGDSNFSLTHARVMLIISSLSLLVSITH